MSSANEKTAIPPGGEQKVLSQAMAEPKAQAEDSRPKIAVREIDSEELGFKILHEPANPDEITVDIVAVHGLAADPDWTWTYTDRPADGPKREINWLKDSDMLQTALPKARIMRFGYDSIWYGPGAVKQRLANIANEMLTDLKYERMAYNLAKSNDVDYPGIFASTTGMIFIGTPHQGAGKSLHSQGQIYQAIAANNMQTEAGILRTLEEGNETLVDVVREFTRHVNLKPPPVNVFCFFEQKSTIVGKIVKDNSIQEFVVDESSGVLHGHPYTGLPLDHFNLNKYKSPRDRNFIRVKNEILTMVKASKALLESRRAVQKFVAPSEVHMMSRHPVAFSRLPFGRDPIFAPRSDILNRINDKFGKAVKVALCGMSGNGKTHIAIEYAHKYNRDFPIAKVLWVNARTAEQFERSYKIIAEDLRIQNMRGNILKGVQRHLGQEANGNWLMVLDGVDDEDALRTTGIPDHDNTKNPGTKSLLDYIPESMGGRVLITSRSLSLASSLVNQKTEYVIEVLTLADDDAVLLLYGTIPKDTAKKQIAVELAQGLGRSPLAVSMAAAYIKTQGSDFFIRNYLQLLSSVASKPAQNEKEEAELATDKTWKISYKFVKDKNAEAARLMLVIGTFDLQEMRTFFLAKGTDARAQFNEHISLLVTQGLIKQSEDRTEVSVMPPIQLCAQRTVAQSDDPVWAGERALALVAAAFPAADNEEFETCEILHPCATVVLNVKPKTTAGKNDRATLLFKLAGYNKYLGKHELALQYLQDCLKLREEQPDKNKDLIKETNKALEGVRDDQRRAESAPEVAVSGGPQSKSPAWNRVVTKVQGVANVSSQSTSQEQFQQMQGKMKAELAEREKALGKDHEETLRKADDLATALHKRDPTGETISIRKRVLEWCTNTYGPRSLDTIRQTYNLALTYDAQGHYDEAAELYRVAFESAEELLAPGSPELLRILSSMGVMYVAQGKMEKAEEALRVALAGQHAKLGPDHPETLLTRQNAALAAQTLGKLDVAEKDLAHVMEAQTRFLGPENEATLRTACSLALNFRLRGRHKESETLYQLTLEGQQKVLGSDHPDTLMTRLMLGELLQEMGKVPQAREEYKAVLDGRKKLCGEAHPDTVYAKSKLAAVA
ncbi:hypothetical protein ABW20_dc0102989 [Dactylellina cionopaga]|nr:hypothetical protein ABW20_dc0102989 [Dactylellina cionopaga]